MKKLTLCTLILSFCAISAEAQTDVDSDIVNTALQQMNVEQTLWFNSTNSAGMVFGPLKRYNTVSLDGEMAKGDFKPSRLGTKESAVIFNTSGALQYNGFSLWGYFKFDNNFTEGAKYNVSFYDQQSRNPYSLADFAVSDWKRQSYDMGFKLATPLLWDKMSFGIDMSYASKVGAKQMDPRTETYRYDAKIRPSAAISLGRNSRVGMTLSYERYFERNDPSVQNYAVNPRVAIMRGLGFYSLGTVGGNTGLEEFLYSGNRYGGSLQYAIDKADFEMLADISFDMETIDVTQNPTTPQMMGTASTTYIDAHIQALFGEQKNQKLSVRFDMSNTDGIEYVQTFNSDPKVQKWITNSTNTMSNYSLIEATLAYDIMTGIKAGKGYSWMFGAMANFRMQSDIYYIPQSIFDATGAYAELNATKNIAFSSKTFLLIGVNGGYRYSLGGQYLYAGTTNVDSDIIKDFYPKELECLTADYVSAGANVALSIKTGKRTSLYLKADGRYLKPMATDTNRLTVRLSIGCLF
ncbi:MAG: hypothetical protein SOZ00_08375 [Tidjanibacter sp.]|nr:hypothetical protein [Tidjanibacter sp.]